MPIIVFTWHEHFREKGGEMIFGSVWSHSHVNSVSARCLCKGISPEGDERGGNKHDVFPTWVNLLDSKFQNWIRPLNVEDWDRNRPRGPSEAQRCSSEVTERIHNAVYRYNPQWHLPFNHPLTILARWNLPTSQKTIYLSITLSRLIHHCEPW